MKPYPPVDYTIVEIRSFLPTGWNLADDGDGGAWDPEQGVWRTKVRDGAHMDWTLEVKAADAERLGRLEALSRAVDRLYRTALG